jgi:hypothetical protein
MLSEPDSSKRRRPVWRHVRTGVIGAALVAGAIVAAIYTGSGAHAPSASHGLHQRKDPHTDYAPLLAAVTATTDSSSFDFTFAGSDLPGTQSGGSGGQTLTFDGNGVVNTSPYVTISRTDSTSSYGSVSLVVDDSDAWQFGAGDFGVTPGSDTGPGYPLSQFGREVENSIGTGEGGLAMMGLADPYGRLDLAENMITSAKETGTGTVDGTAVTIYAVTINVENEAHQTGLSPEQQATINQALTFLQQQGYTGTSEVVSVDGAGFIREIKSTVTFGSGASVVGDQTYSDFGCAGTVIPGSPVVQPAPAGCVSPDQPGAAAPTSGSTTTTSSSPTTTTSTQPPPTTSTTEPVSSTSVPTTTSTTGPVSPTSVLPTTSTTVLTMTTSSPSAPEG